MLLSQRFFVLDTWLFIYWIKFGFRKLEFWIFPNKFRRKYHNILESQINKIDHFRHDSKSAINDVLDVRDRKKCEHSCCTQVRSLGFWITIPSGHPHSWEESTIDGGVTVDWEENDGLTPQQLHSHMSYPPSAKRTSTTGNKNKPVIENTQPHALFVATQLHCLPTAPKIAENSAKALDNTVVAYFSTTHEILDSIMLSKNSTQH